VHDIQNQPPTYTGQDGDTYLNVLGAQDGAPTGTVFLSVSGCVVGLPPAAVELVADRLAQRKQGTDQIDLHEGVHFVVGVTDNGAEFQVIDDEEITRWTVTIPLDQMSDVASRISLATLGPVTAMAEVNPTEYAAAPIPDITVIHDGLPDVANWRIVCARYQLAGHIYEVAWGDDKGHYFVYLDDRRIAEFRHKPYIDSDEFRGELVEQALQAVTAAAREVGSHA
jgi:hypothetical protein